MKNALIGLLLLLSSSFAWAQGPAAKPPATRDEYRACLADADAAVSRRAALQKRRVEFEGRGQQLAVDQKAHVDAGPTIKKGSRLAEAYNLEGEKLNVRSMSLNAEAEQIEKDVAEHNRLSADASKRCSGLTVSTEDMKAVNEERAAKK